MISSCVTDAAPWRCDVPRQSAPVSPPPMMITCLPAAVIGGSVMSPCCTRFAHGRNSIAWWIPSSSRPGTGRSRHAVAPQARTMASLDASRMSTSMLSPTAGVGPELGALGLHLAQPAVDVALLHLELGDAVAQQAADAVGPLEHEHVVPGPGQLLGGGEAGRAGADDDDALAGLDGRDLRGDPALVPRPVDDLDLDLLDRHGVGVDAEHARRLARSRAQAAGELREVVRGVQPVDGVAPVVAVDEVVPVRDQVAERAAVVAERDAAVHAASRLGPRRIGREVLVDLLPVEQPHRHRPPRRHLARPLQKSSGLAHQLRPPCPRT